MGSVYHRFPREVKIKATRDDAAQATRMTLGVRRRSSAKTNRGSRLTRSRSGSALVNAWGFLPIRGGFDLIARRGAAGGSGCLWAGAFHGRRRFPQLWLVDGLAMAEADAIAAERGVRPSDPYAPGWPSFKGGWRARLEQPVFSLQFSVCRSQESGVRSQESGVRSQESGVRSQAGARGGGGA